MLCPRQSGGTRRQTGPSSSGTSARTPFLPSSFLLHHNLSSRSREVPCAPLSETCFVVVSRGTQLRVERRPQHGRPSVPGARAVTQPARAQHCRVRSGCMHACTIPPCSAPCACVSGQLLTFCCVRACMRACVCGSALRARTTVGSRAASSWCANTATPNTSSPRRAIVPSTGRYMRRTCINASPCRVCVCVCVCVCACESAELTQPGSLGPV
jgi:hypothetical protein